MSWINRRAKYPYVSRETWITRAWLLLRKVINQNGQPFHNDVRVARIMLNHRPTGARNAPAHLVQYLEELIINGPPTPTCKCSGCAPEEDLGEG